MQKTRGEHGGGLGDGRRKGARPISTREPMYVVLRSSRAKGRLSLQRPEFAMRIRAIVTRQSELCRVKVLQFSNEGGSLHFLLLVPSRACYLRFIRSVSGLISRMITGAERGPALRTGSRRASAKSTKKNRFWDVLPYSRIAVGCGSIKAAQRTVSTEVLEEVLKGVAAGLRTAQSVVRGTRKRA